jgi:glycosyltransferase involved in cell wall biosynthesis
MLKRILLFADWYEPGFKAGGPIRSCVNFVRSMSENYQVFVFTSDRDLGSTQPYEGVRTGEWVAAARTAGDAGGARIGDAQVYYSPPEGLGWKNIRRQMDAVQPDFIYLNSMFSVKFTIFPLLINRWLPVRTADRGSHPTDRGSYSGRKPRVVLAPRGMLRDSAVRYKSGKKKLFLSAIRLLGLHRTVWWHATDETEAADVRRFFGNKVKVAVLPNFPAAVAGDAAVPLKEAGEVKLIYIGRIHPIKNLDYLLTVLRDVRTKVKLTIVGAAEDSGYWDKCRQIIKELPQTVEVEYLGEIANHQLPAITARHHIFISPTQGENFGHAILEALSLGKPALISDQTPWRGLAAAKAGWDIPLDSPGRFREAIEQAGAFGQEEYEGWSCSARQHVKKIIDQQDLINNYQKLFT